MGDISGLFEAIRVPITDVPVKVTDSFLGRNSVLIKNLSKNYVYIGGKDTVNSSTGYPIGLNESLTVGIAERSFQVAGFFKAEIWAVCAPGASSSLALLQETKEVQRVTPQTPPH